MSARRNAQTATHVFDPGCSACPQHPFVPRPLKPATDPSITTNQAADQPVNIRTCRQPTRCLMKSLSPRPHCHLTRNPTAASPNATRHTATAKRPGRQCDCSRHILCFFTSTSFTAVRALWCADQTRPVPGVEPQAANATAASVHMDGVVYESHSRPMALSTNPTAAQRLCLRYPTAAQRCFLQIPQPPNGFVYESHSRPGATRRLNSASARVPIARPKGTAVGHGKLVSTAKLHGNRRPGDAHSTR